VRPEPSAVANADREIHEVLSELAPLVPPETLRQMEADLRDVEPAQLPMVLRTCRAVCERLRTERDKQQAAAVADRIAQLAASPRGMQGAITAPGAGAAAAAARAPWQTSLPPERAKTAAAPPPRSANQPPLGDRSITSHTDPAPPPAWSPPGGPAGAASAGHMSATEPIGRPTQTDEPRPAQTAPGPPETEEWRRHLDRAILALEWELPSAPRTPGETNQQAVLRMMYLLAGRRADALRPVGGASPELEDFWTKQLYGLDTMLDVERIASPARRAAESSRYLREAVRRAGEMSPLVVRNLAFCTKIASFGQIERFASDDLAPGQAVLLYAELENFKSLATADGYKVSLKARYEIEDPDGRIMEERDLEAVEETCQNPRTDFFLSYRLKLPERLAAGEHKLRVTVEDVLGRKFASGTITFGVRPK
jgi:hypothetical protein